LGLAQKANDLLFAEFACSHVHHSPGGWTSWKFGWYGLWGAGHILWRFSNQPQVPKMRLVRVARSVPEGFERSRWTIQQRFLRKGVSTCLPGRDSGND
ncbi:hypothetical protein, partial [Rhodoferax sp.]|uniref:hypothetical protein n=1 Tax=Rhodoferax sp. TaxID=50421 RepID=UPI003783CEAD